MERRKFLKILGAALIAPKAFIEILDEKKKVEWSEVPYDYTNPNAKATGMVFQRNDAIQKVWAKRWWQQAKEDTYFTKILNQ